MLLDENRTIHDRIMGKDPESFISHFNVLWEKSLLYVNPKYSSSAQMKLGHRLRPVTGKIKGRDFGKQKRIIISNILQ